MESNPSINKENYNHLPFGLLSKEQEPTAIPLKSLFIDIKIVNNLAIVTYNQNYINNTDKLLEIDYFFQSLYESCFYEFKAKIDNKEIKGIIMEKQKAKEAYNEALNQGNTAAIAALNQEISEIIKVSLGNLGSNQEISLSLTCIYELELIKNLVWRLNLALGVRPRYAPQNLIASQKDAIEKKDLITLSHYPVIESGSVGYPWNIQLEFLQIEVIYFSSLSHKMKQLKQNCYELDQQEIQYPDRNFIIEFGYKNCGSIGLLINSLEHSIVYLNYLMKNEEVQIAEGQNQNQDVFEQYLKRDEQTDLQIDFFESKGEFIFLLDRSGSMSGNRIDMAKEALLYFIKSLPSQNYFNIFSFGSNYSSLFGESVETTDENIQNALEIIESYSANFGGTELHQPLKQIFSLECLSKYPKKIFLLTDGAISNLQAVEQLAQQNKDKAKIFTLGIGDGCSEELVRSLAEITQGSYDFVQKIDENLTEKVIKLLEKSAARTFSDLKLRFSQEVPVEYEIKSNDKNLEWGNCASFWITFDQKKLSNYTFQDAELEFFDSKINQILSQKVDIRICDECLQDPLKKLADWNFVKFLKKIGENKEIIEKEAVKRQILCQQTAFFCMINEQSQTGEKVNVLVPTVQQVQPKFLQVKTLTGKTINIPYKPNQSFNFIKQQIQDLEGIPHDQQRLIFSGRQPFDNLSIEEQGITQNSTLHLVLRLRGNGGGGSNICSPNAFKQPEPEISSFKNKKKEPQDFDKLNPELVLKELIKLQNSNGSWSIKNFQKDFLQKIDTYFNSKYFSNPVPKILNQEEEENNSCNIWLTICIIIFIQSQYGSIKNNWKLIVQKSKIWLINNQKIDLKQFNID